MHPLKPAVQENVTLGIKTLWRPACLKRLLTSIRKYYPTIPIVCVDDSKEPSITDPSVWGNLTYIKLPFDTGLGASRNVMIDAVKTKYAVYLDDDYYFFNRTILERFYAILEADLTDLVGGRCKEGRHIRKFHGLLKQQGTVMHYYRKFHGRDQLPLTETGGVVKTLEVCHCDIVVNFFMARTAMLQQVKWDGDLKINTHSEFFFRAHKAMRIAYCQSVDIGHAATRHREYSKLRHRRHWNIIKKKHGLTGKKRHGNWR